jgi:cell division protein FtsW
VLLFGIRVNGMKGWYKIGDITIQPSEIGRSLFLVAVCYLFSININSIKRIMLFIIIAIGGIFPIVLQPDLGGAIVFSLILYIIYFLREKKLKYLLFFPVLGLIGVVLFCLKHQYALKRITGFLDPEADLHRSGWHIMQFKFAIARGHLAGVKTTNAAWSKSYLPFSYNDSIFASTAEITGFVGIVILIALIMLLTYLLVKKVHQVDNIVAKLYLIGAAGFIIVQSFLHSSVNLALLPPTGITFPFFSFGGSSFIGFSILLGFALSASKCTTIETK